MVNSGIIAIFNRAGMLSFWMMAIGNKAKVKSQRMFSAEYRYVRLMMISTEMQVPSGIVLSQKYEMGRHWNKVMRKKVKAVKLLRTMTA